MVTRAACLAVERRAKDPSNLFVPDRPPVSGSSLTGLVSAGRNGPGRAASSSTPLALPESAFPYRTSEIDEASRNCNGNGATQADRRAALVNAHDRSFVDRGTQLPDGLLDSAAQ